MVPVFISKEQRNEKQLKIGRRNRKITSFMSGCFMVMASLIVLGLFGGFLFLIARVLWKLGS